MKILLEPAHKVVEIDDEHGPRNETTLKRIGRLWYVPSGEMYVYYQPDTLAGRLALPSKETEGERDSCR